MAMAQAMLQARRSIYIAGWFISPQVLLIRDDINCGSKPSQYSLLNILKTKAEEVSMHR